MSRRAEVARDRKRIPKLGERRAWVEECEGGHARWLALHPSEREELGFLSEAPTRGHTTASHRVGWSSADLIMWCGVVARREGVGPALTTYRIPIEGREE